MKILLVKLSSLGDVVHTLPVLQDIHTACPGAQVDWVIEQSFAPLLQLLQGQPHGLHRVIPCQLRRWRRAPLAADTRVQWAAFKAQLQEDCYEAVIDLQGLSKSALVARLARLAPGGQRYALANQTDGSGYEAPTRWVADVAITIAPHTAAVPRARELVARALGWPLHTPPHYGLQAALQSSTADVDRADMGLNKASKPPVSHASHAQSAIESVARCVVLVHGTSRADKEWPLAHWTDLGQRLAQAGYQIGLPHGNPAELATSIALAEQLNRAVPGCAQVWPTLPLDALTRALAPCAGVIGVDSGVSHIAVALDLPHVQIYNFDTAWRTGPEPAGRQRSVFAQPTPSVDAVWQAWLACLTVPPQAAPAHCDVDDNVCA